MAPPRKTSQGSIRAPVRSAPGTAQAKKDAKTPVPSKPSGVANTEEVEKPIGKVVDIKTAADLKDPPTKPAGEKKAPFHIQEAGTGEQYLNLMVYAEYGVGKTFLMGTSVSVPQMEDVLLIDAESGDLTLTSTDSYDFDKIDRIKVTDYSQISRVYEYLAVHCKLRDSKDPDDIERLRKHESKLKGREIKKPRRYRTVIIDSLTEVETYCMYGLLGINDMTAIDEETASPEWNEYKKQNNSVQRLIRKFRNLPMNVLMVCACDYVQDDQKRMLYVPKMTGQLRNSCQGFMDMVGYMVLVKGSDDEMHRRMWVQPVGRFKAKCRFSNYTKTHFDDPTLAKILKAVGLTSGKSAKAAT